MDDSRGEIEVVKCEEILIPYALFQYNIVATTRGGMRNIVGWVYGKRKEDGSLELKADSSGPYGNLIVPYEKNPRGMLFHGKERDAERMLLNWAREIAEWEAEKRDYYLIV